MAKEIIKFIQTGKPTNTFSIAITESKKIITAKSHKIFKQQFLNR